MLYTNEEPLVQKTCIKTANLQHDNYQSEKLETQALTSHSLLSKADESSRSIPEKLKLQTLVCGHQVLSSLFGQESRVHLSKTEYAGSDGRLSAVVR